MQLTLKWFAFCVGLGILAQQLSAHHSFSAEFDARQPATFEGVVTKVEWTNPHVYFYADVKGKEGQVENWAFQTAGPNQLTRSGWDRNSLKAGDHVTVVGYPARDGAKLASARSVVLANGHRIFAGSPLDGGPQP
jgi:V8-like Glu-specific endopeptidase